MSVTALETVAGNRSKPVGGFCPQGRIPYPISTLTPPPLAYAPVPFPTYPFDSPKALALRQEVETMLSKGALERVSEPGPGFYSHLFLMEKASGGWRPVIDLSPFNEFVQQTPFKMETATSVLLSVRKGDFLASIDLKDAYFQIPVHVSSRKWLCFVSNVTVHQFKVLCFGLSTVPQVFTRVFATVLAWAHAREVRVLRYLDDWLVLASTEARARQHVRDLLSLCNSLGVVLNREKSDLNPSQSVEYLGMTIDTVAARVYPTLPHINKFIATARKFLARRDPAAQFWQVLLGHMSSLEKLVPRRRLRMRSLQWHLKSHWSPERDPPNLPVPRSRQVEEDLSWWMVRDLLLEGTPFGTPTPDLRLYSDASRAGWGAHLLDQLVSGVWSHQESSLHINLLELKALFLARRAFCHLVTDHRVTTMCDNSTVVAYVNKQGGTVSNSLCSLTGQLFQWTESNKVQLEAKYLPGQSNVLADLLSRRNQVLGEEWSLHLQVARELLCKWGSPTLDLFATHLRAKLLLYCSLIPDPQALFEDAFRHPWNNLDTYALPPFQLVKRVVARVRETPNLLMTLVAPLWPEKAWFAELLLLLTQPPLALPLWDRLLRQPHFHRFHGGLHALNLHSWRLLSVSSENQAFREELRSNCPAIPESPLHAYTSRSGSLSVVGVVEGALLQSTPLYP